VRRAAGRPLSAVSAAAGEWCRGPSPTGQHGLFSVVDPVSGGRD
jgi:hypothetical protein